MKKELSKKDLENLKSYDPEQFKKLPEKKLKILLVKRGESPYLDKYALPGGFVQIDEELDDAASAEWFTVFMKKETGDIWNLILEGENTTLSARIRQVQQKWSPALILEVVEWDEQIAFDHEEVFQHPCPS